MNLFEQNKQRLSQNLQESYLTEDEIISKSIDSDLLCKGKKANIGEIREWSGKKYQKQSDGTWKEVSEKSNQDDRYGEVMGKLKQAWNSKKEPERMKMKSDINSWLEQNKKSPDKGKIDALKKFYKEYFG